MFGLSNNTSKFVWKRTKTVTFRFLENVFCTAGEGLPINLHRTASAQLIECHFEYNNLLSAYKKTRRVVGSVEEGVIVP